MTDPLPETAHTARHQCGDCGRYVREQSVQAYRDDESGVVEATGTCSRCGVVDVFRAVNPPEQTDDRK